jgi:hypothetical protein
VFLPFNRTILPSMTIQSNDGKGIGNDIWVFFTDSLQLDHGQQKTVANAKRSIALSEQPQCNVSTVF